MQTRMIVEALEKICIAQAKPAASGPECKKTNAMPSPDGILIKQTIGAASSFF